MFILKHELILQNKCQKVKKMYRFLILFCTYMQIVMTNPHLLDRFFGKPVDESMDLFRNPKIHPYVYINEKSVCN